MDTNRSSASIAFARLYWMLAGPTLLLLLAGLIAQEGYRWFAPINIAFLLVLLGVVIARRVDPKTGYDEPTTPAQLRRFTIGALLGGLAVWLIANAVGKY